MTESEYQKKEIIPAQENAVTRHDYQENENIIIPVQEEQPIKLGFLYDCRTDTVIPMSVFRGDVQLEWQPMPRNKSSWRQIENRKDRSELLDITGKMKLSLLGWGMELGGSLRYMTKESSYEESIVVGVKSEVITGTISVNPASMAFDTAALNNSNFRPTHYVGMVKCGGRLIADLSYRVTHSADAKNIRGELSLEIGRLITSTVSVDGLLELAKDSNSIHRTIDTDYTLSGYRNPDDVAGFKKLFTDFPELVEQEKPIDGFEKGTGTILEYVLYPLSSIPEFSLKIDRLYQRISENILERLFNVIFLEIPMMFDELNQIKHVRMFYKPVLNDFNREIDNKIQEYRVWEEQLRQDFHNLLDKHRTEPADQSHAFQTLLVEFAESDFRKGFHNTIADLQKQKEITLSTYGYRAYQNLLPDVVAQVETHLKLLPIVSSVSNTQAVITLQTSSDIVENMSIEEQHRYAYVWELFMHLVGNHQNITVHTEIDSSLKKPICRIMFPQRGMRMSELTQENQVIEEVHDILAMLACVQMGLDSEDSAHFETVICRQWFKFKWLTPPKQDNLADIFHSALKHTPELATFFETQLLPHSSYQFTDKLSDCKDQLCIVSAVNQQPKWFGLHEFISNSNQIKLITISKEVGIEKQFYPDDDSQSHEHGSPIFVFYRQSVIEAAYSTDDKQLLLDALSSWDEMKQETEKPVMLNYGGLSSYPYDPFYRYFVLSQREHYEHMLAYPAEDSSELFRKIFFNLNHGRMAWHDDLTYHGQVFNDKPRGQGKVLDKHGKVIEEGHFFDGKKHGPCKVGGEVMWFNRQSPRQELTICFVGKTGSGKSTLINALYNWLLGIDGQEKTERRYAIKSKSTKGEILEAEEKFRHLNTDDMDREKGSSATILPAKYTFVADDVILHVIDTPGFADTGGMEKNIEHLKNILEHITQANQVDLFGIVWNEKRLTAEQKFVIGALKELLPRDSYQNIAVCVTNTLETDHDTREAIEEAGLEKCPIICFENSWVVSEWNQIYEIYRDKADKSFDELITYAKKADPISSEIFKSISKKKKELEWQRTELYGDIKNLDNEKQALEKARSELDDLSKKIEDIEIITTKVTPKKTPKKWNTYCKVCLKNCHVGCGLGLHTDLSHCWAMNSKGMCNQCGCRYTIHTHECTHWEEENVIEKFEHSENIKKKKSMEQDLENREKIKKDISQRIDGLDEKIELRVKGLRIVVDGLSKLVMAPFNPHYAEYLEVLEENAKQSGKMETAKIFSKERKEYMSFIDHIKDAKDHAKSRIKDAKDALVSYFK